jgi:iron(III) transport system ATP-binding protein
MTFIRIQGVRKHFGTTLALDDVSLEVAAGELFFLLGPSGCGKTTLLRMLAGFVQPDAGDIFFGDKPVTALPPRLRETAMVFQAYALWPHMTVAQNVAFGLNVRGVGRKEAHQRVDKALALVRMEGFGERRPTQLSGGQQQRVALARALVIEPRVLLLDEPLSNLDARLRDEMREEIRRLHQETGLTMVYVTHDQKEALALAGRLAVMDKGRLVQAGAPLEVYQRPVNRFVAGFLGDCNFIPGTVRKTNSSRCTVETAIGSLEGMALPQPPAEGSAVVCSIRPQDLTLDPMPTVNRISAKVKQISFLGEMVQLQVMAAGPTPLAMMCLPHMVHQLKPGDDITVTVGAEQVVIFHA